MPWPAVPAEVAAHWHEPWRYAHRSWFETDVAPPQWAVYAQGGLSGQRLGASTWFDHFGLGVDAAWELPPPVAPRLNVDAAPLAAAWLGLWLASSLRLPGLQPLCRQAMAAGLGAPQLRSALALARPDVLIGRWTPPEASEAAAMGPGALGLALLRWATSDATGASWIRMAWCFPAPHAAEAPGRPEPVPLAVRHGQGEHDALLRPVLTAWKAGCRAVAIATAAPA